MSAGRLWKIFRLNVKQMYSRWFLALIAFIFAVSFMASASARRPEDYSSLFAGLGSVALLLAFSGLFGSLSLVKSEVDFVFSTPADPLVVYIAKTAASAVLPLFLLAAYTASLPRPDAASYAEYAASLIFDTAFFALMAGASSLVPIRRRILYAAPPIAVAAATLVRPELSPLYGLVHPSPAYVAYSGAAAALAFLATPRGHLDELAANAYGVLAPHGVLAPPGLGGAARVAGPARIGPTPWRAVWTTSVNGAVRVRLGGPQGGLVVLRRVNAFKIVLPLSAAGAAVYYLVLRLLPGADFWVTFASFSNVSVFSVLYAGSTVASDRLWLSVAAEPARYFRLRMLARAAIAAISLAPWAAVYALESLSYPPAAYLVPAVAALALTLPAVSWLAAAYSGLPQIRELGLSQSQFRFTPRIALASFLYLVFADSLSVPYLLSFASLNAPALAPLLRPAADVTSAASLALSAAFFYLTTYSPWASSIWSWFVNKLSEDGYV
ncbi:MAG: hypothetical protein RXN90_00315 [Thermoproteus sp.]